MANSLNKMPTSNAVGQFSASEINNMVKNSIPQVRDAWGNNDVNAQNFTQFGQLILSNDDWRNSYIHTLHDKIGLYFFGYNVFENDLSSLRKDFLRTGAVVDEMQMDLIEPMKYNPEIDWRLALANFVPTYLEIFHKINRAVVYPLTVSRQQLERAFTSEQSFMEFLSAQYTIPVESNNADEYECFLDLIRYVAQNVAYYVQVAGFGSKDNVELSTISLRTWALDLRKPSRLFNIAGFKRSVPVDRMILITKSDILSSLDVLSLATAFNMDKADFIANRVYTVPSWVDLGGCDALLGDERAFQIYDVVYATDENHNGLTRSQNYFLHVQQIYSTSIVYPVIAFKASQITPTTLGAFSPATGSSLAKGSTTMVKCAITAGDNKQIHYTISGAYDPNTDITPYGLLYIGQKEKASQITVTATVENSDGNGTPVSAKATYSITGNDPVFGAVSPQANTVLTKGSSQMVYVDLIQGKGTPVFSLQDPHATGTTITPTGFLTIGDDETNATVKVKVALGNTTKIIPYTINLT